MNALNFEQYAKFKELISTQYGLFFSEDKKPQIESAVLSVFSESTFSDLDNYHSYLANDKSSSEELQKLVNTLTVGETHFYRNHAHINALRHHILPEIVSRNNASKKLRIWSAGCSTGEEPYTIAMLLHELLPGINLWKIFLLGTDVNDKFLMKAQKAMYGDWSFRNTPESVRNNYFQVVNGKYQLCDKIRHMVTFRQHNLMAFHTYPAVLDLILCRNVTIYFKRETAQKIAAKVHDVLVDSGWLLVGHSEPATDIYQHFKVKFFPGTVIYQKPESRITSPPAVSLGTKRKGLLSSQQSGEKAGEPEVKAKLGESPEGESDERARPFTRPSPLPFLPHHSVLTQPKPQPGGDSPRAKNKQLNIQKDASKTVSNEPLSLQSSSAVVEGETSPYEMAVKLMDESDYERAVAKLQEQLQLQPTHVKSYYKLALIYQQQEQWDDAIDMLKKAIYVERDFVLAHFILANLYKKTGKGQLAQKFFENTARLLSEKPDYEIIPNSDGLTVGRLVAAVSASLGYGGR